MISISLLKRIEQNLERKVSFYFSRRKAHHLRRQVIAKKGCKIVNRGKKRMLKSYAKKTFGSSSFWPWLSLYTELRGEFKKGWIPEDYYTVYILKKFNPESIRISDYKTLDNKIFPDFSLEPLILKIGENFYDRNWQQLTACQAQTILYDYNDEVVLKEDLSWGGRKIKFIESRDFTIHHFAHISSYIVQPVIQQHENLKLLNSKAVNTVRVITYLNTTGDIDVKYAYMRFGFGDSRVDNVSSGGGFCFIKSKGNLDDIAYNDLGIPIGSKHPDSGTSFKSVTIPSYDKLLGECIAAHKLFPYVRLVGWDVTVKETGVPVLLEWNLRPLLWLPEALHGPFFSKELLRNGISKSK